MMAFSQAGSASGPTPTGPPLPALHSSHSHSQSPVADPAGFPERQRRKRKSDFQDANNERLHKRMSLLNLEQNGPKLYVPVEQAHLPPPASTSPSQPARPSSIPIPIPIPEEEPMQLDDTKHKVYIYNLDDELSSSDSEPSSPREGRLVLLPDIERHLRANRIPVPRPILPNRDGELAGMQMVLYQPDGPKSISVPEEHDSVRRAIVAARERVREKQALARSGGGAERGKASGTAKGTVSFATPVKFPSPVAREEEGMVLDDQNMGQPSSSAAVAGFGGEMDAAYDPDAMDID